MAQVRSVGVRSPPRHGWPRGLVLQALGGPLWRMSGPSGSGPSGLLLAIRVGRAVAAAHWARWRFGSVARSLRPTGSASLLVLLLLLLLLCLCFAPAVHLAGAVPFASRRAGLAVWFACVVVLFWFCCVAVGLLFCLSLVAFVALFFCVVVVVVSFLLSPRFLPALPVFVSGFLARGCRRGRVTRRLTRAHRPALYIHACPARPSYATAPAGRLGRGCRMMHRVASVVCLPFCINVLNYNFY